MANFDKMFQRITIASGWLRVPAFGRAPLGGEVPRLRSSNGIRPTSTQTAVPSANLPVEPGPGPIDALSNLAPLLLISSTVEDGREVWRAEAEHRLNNFAQLAAAVATLKRRRVDAPHTMAIAVQAEALARAYARLNNPVGDTGKQATAALLDQIATGLVVTFAEAVGFVRLSFDCQEMLLAHAHRRALVLILSELVVNALKYAFPAGRAGTICVSLRITDSMAELIVTDDGVGSSGAGKAGQGEALLDQMAAMLSGRITRERIATGGLHVAVRFPVGTDAHDAADQYGGRTSRSLAAPFNSIGTASVPA